MNEAVSSDRMSDQRLLELLAEPWKLKQGDTRAILAELLTSRAEPVVRGLEWRDDRFGSEAPSPVGRYMVEDMGANWIGDRFWLQLNAVLGKYGTIAEAKAAAQADYERRIRSALVEKQHSACAICGADKRAEAAEGLAASETFQMRVAAAHVALFNDDPTDLAERRDRFGEEANEVQQALGQTREAAHQLVDYTYDRPVGRPEKEIGAAAVTLTSLCVIGGWDVAACAEADLAKLQQPESIARIRAKRSTRHGRGPLPGYPPEIGAVND